MLARRWKQEWSSLKCSAYLWREPMGYQNLVW